MTIETTIAEMIDLFAMLPDWEERYAQIIAYGKDLAPYPEEFRNETFRVKGCQSNVWLHPTFDGQRVHFDADSDAVIVRGLTAMLMRVYDHRTPDEILATKPDFLAALGLDQHLSQNRTNGLASMVKQIMMYAFAFRSLGSKVNT